MLLGESLLKPVPEMPWSGRWLMCRLFPQSFSSSFMLSFRAHGVTRDVFANKEGGMARILIYIMNLFLPPFFNSFSLLYRWQTALPVKPLFVKGGGICFYSPYRLFQTRSFLALCCVNRNDSSITTWLQLLTSNPHLDEDFCEEKDKKYYYPNNHLITVWAVLLY